MEGNKIMCLKKKKKNISPTNGHEVEILMHTEAGHFGGFVARDRGEYPSAERIPTVSLVKIPDLYLKK